MEAALATLRELAKNANDVARKELLEGLRTLSWSLETQQDSMQRLFYLVRPTS
jgi:hypothetical protein